MPEYLAPGVYVEEVSFRSKSIEGVPTSTTGFAGLTRYGPVQYTEGPSTSEPRLITSYTEFERVYGGLAQLEFEGVPPRESYLAHAARAFFLNGGRRLYVSRVFVPLADDDNGCANLERTISGADTANWTARWPGRYGNVLLTVRPVRKGNCSYQNDTFGTQARGLTHGAVVEITTAPDLPPDPGDDVATGQLRVVDVDPTTVDDKGLRTRRSATTQVRRSRCPPAR